MYERQLIEAALIEQQYDVEAANRLARFMPPRRPVRSRLAAVLRRTGFRAAARPAERAAPLTRPAAIRRTLPMA
jgi:hypothetical protein